MSLSFSYNGKLINSNGNETFGDLHTKNDFGDFNKKEWNVDGKIIFVQKNTQIYNFIKNSSLVICKIKLPQNAQTLQPTNDNKFIAPMQDFGKAPQFGPPSGFVAPQQSFPQNNPPLPGFQKKVPILDQSGEKEISKEIDQYKLTITNWGTRVILEQRDLLFKAVLDESDATEAEQCKITFSKDEVISNQEEQLTLFVGKNQTSKTKVIFLKNYSGIAVNWPNQLKSKLFEQSMNNYEKRNYFYKFIKFEFESLMIQELSKHINMEDPNIQQALKQLKILELEIPFDQQVQLVKEIFAEQLPQKIENQKYQIQIGNSYEISLIDEQDNKPALCEYLESQFHSLMELIENMSDEIQILLNNFNSKQSSECRQELQKCQEENQKQIISLNTNQTDCFDTQNPKQDILKNEMCKFIKDQKNLIVYKKQINQLEQKMKENRKIIFENIEEKNDIPELVAQKMEMNIDNELKLLEKTTELKLIAKIESDLQQEVIKLEKNNANKIFNSDSESIQDVDQLEKQIALLFNQICQNFQEMKEQKIKNNDLIFDQLISNSELQLSTLNKIYNQHQTNIHQLIDYLNNYPNIQQILREDAVDKIQEQKNDYLFCQQISIEQQSKQQDNEEIDEFLKLTKNHDLMQEETKQLAQNFNDKLEKQYSLLQNLKEYLLQLTNF